MCSCVLTGSHHCCWAATPATPRRRHVTLRTAHAGIGRPPAEGQLDVASYVLQEFRRSELEAVEAAIAESRAIVESCLALGLERALSGSRL